MSYLKLIPPFIAIGFLLFSGCSQKLFHYNSREQADFGEFETFAFLPNPDTTKYDQYDSEIIHYRSMVEITDELNNRGYRMDTTNPDLLIAVNPLFRDIGENPYNNWPDNYGGPGHLMYYRGLTKVPYVDGSDYPELEYAQGTLLVDIFENGSLNLLYRAWSDQVIQPNPLPSELDNYIGRLMQKFPDGS